jgi:7-cyano-7-deazaguanine tRNA-ribosyltransferase
MDFYVSWYPGDPDYPLYDDDCSMLISITSVSKEWNIRSLPNLPDRLIVDSGGYRYSTVYGSSIVPRNVLERQLSMLSDLEIPTVICACDFPILDDSLPSNGKDKKITQTIAYAYEMKSLIERYELPDYVTPMAIIQGYDADSLRFCAQELVSLDFPVYGLGSLASINNYELVNERIGIAASIIKSSKLHVFGVGKTKTIYFMRRWGVRSFDTATPARAAAYNEVIYSEPYRRLSINRSRRGNNSLPFSQNKYITEPLPCECPVCLEDPYQILKFGRRKFIRKRALHNYFQMKKAFLSEGF